MNLARCLFVASIVCMFAGCAGVPPYRESAVSTTLSSCETEYEDLDAEVRKTGQLADEKREREVVKNIEATLKDATRKSCWLTPWEKHRDYDLFSVEFDDQGWAADSFDSPKKKDTQFKTLFDGLNAIYGKVGQQQPLNIVIYTHGWHHSASPEDTNVVRFRTMLEGLTLAEKSLATQRAAVGNASAMINKPRHVVGIYLGWRGNSILGWGLEDLSIWDRKTVAEKVAHGAIQELYANMNQFFNEHNCRARRLKADELAKCADVRMLTVGHSFGGLITYRALSSRLLAGIAESDATIDCAPGDRRGIRYAHGIGNLTVLINPAFEGTRFEPLARAVMSRDYQAPDMGKPCNRTAQLPVLVIAQSEGDLATKLAFPAFRSATTLLENTHGYGTAESKSNISTVGWTERYWTHRLSLAKADDECQVADDASLDVRGLAESRLGQDQDRLGICRF